MLEKTLREPTLLTDDDVMELMALLFHGEAAQRKLDALIEKQRKTLTTDGSENSPILPHYEKVDTPFMQRPIRK